MPQGNESWQVLRDLSRLSKNVTSQPSSQYSQIYVSLKVKSCYNEVGQFLSIFTFEDIVQSRFYEILFKCK